MFCPQCGKRAADDANFCSSCGRVIARPAGWTQTRIVRPRQERIVGGVLAGVALHYGWDLTLVRIVFVALVCLTSGLAGLAYLIAWALMPDAPYALPMASSGQSSSI